jgi:hypothetical protein
LQPAATDASQGNLIHILTYSAVSDHVIFYTIHTRPRRFFASKRSDVGLMSATSQRPRHSSVSLKPTELGDVDSDGKLKTLVDAWRDVMANDLFQL